ncbi:hypothetical protein DFH27DRAFT_610905 [Peziza echinospora]|nr:hypothetical protein DFH27DRAFT_610905 [Peziza echinospora]
MHRHTATGAYPTPGGPPSGDGACHLRRTAFNPASRTSAAERCLWLPKDQTNPHSSKHQIQLRPPISSPSTSQSSTRIIIMSSRQNVKDQRRADLIIPYIPAQEKVEQNDFATTISSTLPMAALFTRNKIIAWSSLVFAVQSWLTETPAQLAGGKQPAYFGVGMSLMSVAVTYAPMFMPERVQPSVTAPPPAQAA